MGKGRKICTKQYSYVNLSWTGLPTSYLPCPHKHFKQPTPNRDVLTKDDHINLLATPKGYRWSSGGSGDKKRKCSKKKKHRAINSGEEKYIHSFLDEVWTVLTPEMIEKLKDILVMDFKMTHTEAEQFVDEQQRKNKESRQSAVCKCPCARAAAQVPRLSVRHLWIREFTEMIACKFSDYIVMMLCGKRTKRVKILSQIILQHLCDITGEDTTLSSPKTRVHKLMVFVSDRVAIWLDGMLEETEVDMARDRDVECPPCPPPDDGGGDEPPDGGAEGAEAPPAEARSPAASAPGSPPKSPTESPPKSPPQSPPKSPPKSPTKSGSPTAGGSPKQASSKASSPTPSSKAASSKASSPPASSPTESSKAASSKGASSKGASSKPPSPTLASDASPSAPSSKSKSPAITAEPSGAPGGDEAPSGPRPTTFEEAGDRVLSVGDMHSAVEMESVAPTEEPEEEVEEEEEEAKRRDLMDVVTEWISGTDPDDTDRQAAIDKVVRDRLTKEVEEEGLDDETQAAIIKLSAKVSTWVDKLAAEAEAEAGLTGQPEPCDMAPKKKSVVYHIKKGSGNFYDVKQISCKQMMERCAQGRGDVRQWAAWAVDVTTVAEQWAAWIDKWVGQAEEVAAMKKAGELDKEEYDRWRDRTNNEALDYRKTRRDLKKEAMRLAR